MLWNNCFGKSGCPGVSYRVSAEATGHFPDRTAWHWGAGPTHCGLPAAAIISDSAFSGWDFQIASNRNQTSLSKKKWIFCLFIFREDTECLPEPTGRMLLQESAGAGLTALRIHTPTPVLLLLSKSLLHALRGPVVSPLLFLAQITATCPTVPMGTLLPATERLCHLGQIPNTRWETLDASVWIVTIGPISCGNETMYNSHAYGEPTPVHGRYKRHRERERQKVRETERRHKNYKADVKLKSML